jgi:hypothetical protein
MRQDRLNDSADNNREPCRCPEKRLSNSHAVPPLVKKQNCVGASRYTMNFTGMANNRLQFPALFYA